MFEYIKLKNYKSFGDVDFDLRDKKGNPKKFVLIFGENGIGKSNLASAFFLLSETLRTMDVRDIMQSLLSQNPEGLSNEEFARYFKIKYKDIETIIKENKMVGSTEPMYLEFGFKLDGKSGKYILETNDSQIIHERLEYTLAHNRGAYFDITPDKAMISPKIFLDKRAHQEIKLACDKYWGKHSILSILMHESDDKADEYIKQQISENFESIIEFLSRISCKIKFGSRQEQGVIGLPPEILGNLEKGAVNESRLDALDKTEQMLTQFFKLTYRDIERAFYKRTKKENRIRYQLMLEKHIAGELREIDFALESTGTQSLIQQLTYMLVVVQGSVAVIDEFDTGIHDLLVQSLATSLYENLQGQLIMTTHNTLLMESRLPKECIYVINEQPSGNKEIHCITYYDNKIHQNTNIRDQYMMGKYSGIPETARVDFNALLKTIKKS